MSNRSVMLIYLMEALIITALSALIACVCLPVLACILVVSNIKYFFTINYSVVTIVEFVAMFGLSIAIGIIGSIIPIITKSKAKPIDLIKDL